MLNEYDKAIYTFKIEQQVSKDGEGNDKSVFTLGCSKNLLNSPKD